MAFITSEQAAERDLLIHTYGPPNVIKIEWTDEAYGILWMHWMSAGDLPMSRNLFVKPDGSRLAWEAIF